MLLWKILLISSMYDKIIAEPIRPLYLQTLQNRFDRGSTGVEQVLQTVLWGWSNRNYHPFYRGWRFGFTTCSTGAGDSVLPPVLPGAEIITQNAKKKQIITITLIITDIIMRVRLPTVHMQDAKINIIIIISFVALWF